MTDQSQTADEPPKGYERIAVPPEVALEEALGLAEFHRLRALRLSVHLHVARQELAEQKAAYETLRLEVAAIREAHEAEQAPQPSMRAKKAH